LQALCFRRRRRKITEIDPLLPCVPFVANRFNPNFSRKVAKGAKKNKARSLPDGAQEGMLQLGALVFRGEHRTPLGVPGTQR
jgi:hypothetical protein